MKRERMQSNTNESGQAIMLVLLALSLFLFGALGMAVDGCQLYAHRQMAQAAADAAAQAAVMSILDSTNTGTNAFPIPPNSTGFACTAYSTATPCYYASLNGFASSEVQVSFPTSVSGVTNLATGYSPNLISVTVTRAVKTTFMQFLGTSTANVVGHATAAILLPPVPIPIVVTHPTLAQAFQMSSGKIKVTNGPTLSIQVNSCAGKGGNGTNGLACQSGYSIKSSGGNGTCSNTCVDLSTAGPNAGAGTFGNWGEPAAWSTAGNGYLDPSTAYLEPSSALTDPLSSIAAPTTTSRPVITTSTPSATSVAPNPCKVSNTTPYNTCQAGQTYGCPGSPTNTKGYCYLFYPGVYPTTGISVGGGDWALFAPGVYYISAGGANNTGFVLSPANASMATGFTSSAETGTGMTVFLTGKAIVDIAGGSDVTLLGDTAKTTFGGMLFFKDRADTGGTHTLSGGSGMSLTGTIYMTKDNAATNSNGGYNILNISASGSTTNLNGEIIVDTLNLNGNAEVLMNLSGGVRDVSQVALVQ